MSILLLNLYLKRVLCHELSLGAEGDDGILFSCRRGGDKTRNESEHHAYGNHNKRLPPRERGYCEYAVKRAENKVEYERKYIRDRYAYDTRGESYYESFGIEELLYIPLSCADRAENSYTVETTSDSAVNATRAMVIIFIMVLTIVIMSPT